jgi:C1A family cysteine protease
MDILQFEVIDAPYDVRDFQICAAGGDFPAEFRCPLTVPIKNQGSKPTCVAHAVSSLLEYHYKRQTNSAESFSTEFIYGLREPGYFMGDGMVIRNALNTVLKYGDPFHYECVGNNSVKEAKANIEEKIDEYKQMAYPHRISSYYRCSTENAIKTALMEYGPVITSMNTYDGAKLVDDVYTYSPDANYGRHCVMIVGWNEKGWIIQNSWGRTYGGDGYFILPFDFKLNESWGITDDILDNELMIEKPSKFVIFFSSIINIIMNFFNQFTKQK